MDAQHPNAPVLTTSRTPDEDHPQEQPLAGVVHDHVRHTESFTVVGNHLVQHKEMSLLAIGLACYIQSVRQGTSVDIKSLAARFPEGPTRIAAGLRELEKFGYLQRTCTRTSTGRIVTRTVSRNRPGHSRGGAARETAPRRPARRADQEKPPSRKRLPAVPQPSYPAPALLQAAVDVLTGLRRRDPRLLLSATDAEHLAPGVAAWLEREIAPTAVRHALTENLPDEPLIRPAAFLAHRLTAQLPSPPPLRPPVPSAAPEPRHPLQTCDDCDRAFRGPAPGRCRDCRTDRPEGA
ncbi:helix-turn-helix domain-containing protein [Streptomyces sp. NPDC057336]|uniref:helix-turn-helix domain-containing protein n=1 Tax=Streptomyces sp. NPDC057336 TaxID=3346102 RepID=UPI00362E4A05